MYQKLKAFWGSLPHQLQAVIVAFVSGGFAALAHDLSEPGACFTLACLKHLIPTFITAGIVAAKGFYMLPSNTQLEQHNGPSQTLTQRVQELNPPPPPLEPKP